MRSIRDLKLLAKKAMKGNTGWLVLAMVAYSILGFAGSLLTDMFFPGTEISSMILSQAFYFILTLLFGVFYAGVRYMYLKVARGQEYSMEDLIYFYKNNPDHVIVGTLVLAGIALAVAIPINIYTYHMEVGTTVEEQMNWALQTVAFMLLATVLTELFTLPFEMIYCLMADQPGMSGIEAIKGSVRLLRGKLGKLLLLKISFIPIMLLSVFTLYLSLLWIVPYMEMTTVMFYRDLLGELDEQPQLPVGQADPLSYPGDDYNSEA